MNDQTSSANEEPGRALPTDWVDEHADALYRFALLRVSDPHVIEDLLQETYLAAYKSQGSFRGEANIRTWLIAILRLKIIDHYRALARDAKKDLAEQERVKQEFRPQALSAWKGDPTRIFESKEFWITFHRCVEKLPATLARAFLMREVDGLDSGEVCQLLGISNSNLAVRVFRARSSMRDCLDIHWFSKD